MRRVVKARVKTESVPSSPDHHECPCDQSERKCQPERVDGCFFIPLDLFHDRDEIQTEYDTEDRCQVHTGIEEDNICVL